MEKPVRAGEELHPGGREDYTSKEKLGGRQNTGSEISFA